MSKPRLRQWRAKEVGRRLRAVQKYLKLQHVNDLASFFGEQRGTVSAWLNGVAQIPVGSAEILKARTGITMDWIYTGDAGTLPEDLSILLIELLEHDSLTRPAPKKKPSQKGRKAKAFEEEGEPDLQATRKHHHEATGGVVGGSA
jgi:hypothetical protein